MYTSIQDAEQAMSNKKIRKLFKSLWEDEGTGMIDFFDLARVVSPHITYHEFDKGWQYRTVLHERFEVAIQEFTQIMFGAI